MGNPVFSERLITSRLHHDPPVPDLPSPTPFHFSLEPSICVYPPVHFRTSSRGRISEKKKCKISDTMLWKKMSIPCINNDFNKISNQLWKVN